MSQTMTPELFPSHGPSIRAALEVADSDGVTAQRVASARATALQLGLPDSVVEADLQYAQREAQARRIEQNSPFALWAARSKERAALARDDTDGLSGVFSTAKAFGEIRQYEPGFLEALGTYLKEGSEDTAENIVATVGAIAGKLDANDFADQVERLAKQREKRRPAPLESNSAVQNYAGDVVRALPQFAGGVLSYIAGGPLGAVMFGAAQTGGSQYRSLRQENVERDRAFMAAAATAGLSAPLDALGTGKFLNIFKASGARKIFQNAGIAVGTDFVTEWLQTYPEEAARIWGLAEKNGTTLEEGVRLFFDNFWEMTRQGWYEGFVSMPFGLIGGAGKIAADRRASRDAQAFAEQNTALHDAVEASQTKQIAPDYMEDALDHASDVLAQSVYIPAQAALDLAGQGRDVLTPLGITLEEAQKAAASGVDLEVKLSRVHARLDSAGMTAVNDILRQTPGAPNLRELSLIDANDEVQAALSDARQRRRRTEAVRQEEQRLVREMVPLVGKEAAETYGKLNSAQARAFEAAYGVDAAGLMRRRSVGLAGEDADGDALRQAALYEQTPMGDAARASLERDVHDFGVAVDNIVAAGKLPSDPVKMLGQTPLVMQLLGRDTVTGKAAAQGGIHAAPHVFDGTHPNMTPEMWKQIPAAMADPIAVFDSDSPAGRAKGDLVFMLELTDANGATVVVPVALDVAKGRKQAHVNIVKSAYSKESGGVPSNHWFMRQFKKMPVM